MNKATLLGNLGRDPEFFATKDGGSMAKLSIATNEVYKNRNTGEMVSRTDWHTIAVFGGLVDVIKRRCEKGTRVLVEGPLQTREWTDTNGVRRWSTSIIAGRNGHRFEVVANAKAFNATKDAPESAEGYPDEQAGEVIDQTTGEITQSAPADKGVPF